MWKSTRLADHFSPVCPQLAPVAPTGSEALLEMPRQRLAQIRRLMPLLTNQSEDCLYLNLYVPRTGQYHIAICQQRVTQQHFVLDTFPTISTFCQMKNKSRKRIEFHH